jgi:hypothetical protein
MRARFESPGFRDRILSGNFGKDYKLIYVGNDYAYDEEDEEDEYDEEEFDHEVREDDTEDVEDTEENVQEGHNEDL